MTRSAPGSTAPRPAALEITDLLRNDEVGTGLPGPVRVDDVTGRLDAAGQRRAARIVRRMPSHDGVLDGDALDALVLRVHRELNRLAEELQLPRRMADRISDLVDGVPGTPSAPVRVVDVGCGLGYAVRWLAAHGSLGPHVELVGVDHDERLVAEATALADAEGLSCRFVVGDALSPGVAVDDPARTVMVSSGLLHHLPATALPGFFAAHARLGVASFAHWDIRPGRLAVLGALVFHRARMREAVSRHDGVLSARRAHDTSTLLAAARSGAPGYVTHSPADCSARLADVIRPVVGTRA